MSSIRQRKDGTDYIKNFNMKIKGKVWDEIVAGADEAGATSISNFIQQKVLQAIRAEKK